MNSSRPLEPPGTTRTRPTRGSLKIYLGYASHTGKTWRLLEEARRRHSRGEDVVVGWVRGKDEPAHASLLAGLEIVPPRMIGDRPEMDCEAILERAPQVCFIDELAHANVPGSGNAHRWQDVATLLAAGIGVVTAVNIRYLAGVGPAIQELLGAAPEETVPDELVQTADEVALVDATLEPVDGCATSAAGDLALSMPQLLALRQMALLYAARAVEEDLQEYRSEHHIETVWETQERILVCLTAYGRGPHLIDRAQRVASRWKGEFWAVYVASDPEWSSLSEEDAKRVRSYLALARARGARVEIVEDADPVRGILSCARRHNITQIFVGHAAAYPFRGALSRTVTGRILHEADGMDVHVVPDDSATPHPGPRPSAHGSRSAIGLARLLCAAPPRPELRGHQRIYLGYAPGVGKTFQMLLDGQYLREHGQDVVVGFCESRGREDVTQRLSVHEGITPLARDEGALALDVKAILDRRPQICLVDGLADPGAPGKRRWQDVETLLKAGIHVFTTLDVCEVESLKDAVERITGVRIRDTVPDWLVDEADEVLFVDVAPRALLNRVARGAVFPGHAVPERLGPFFTEGSLNALRELAMRLTADRVEDELDALKNPTTSASQEEAIVVCLDERPSAASIIRRGRRVADRLSVPCYAVYVVPDEDWTGVPPETKAAVEEHVELARSLHVETHILYGSDVARTIVDFAVRRGVTRMLLGRSRKTGWREFFRRSVIEHVIRLSPWMDIQVVADR